MGNVIDQVSHITRTLCAYRGISPSALGLRIGLTRQTMSNKMSGKTPFALAEIVAMAEELDVDPKVWFDEPEKALSYLKPRSAPKKGGDFRTGSRSFGAEEPDPTMDTEGSEATIVAANAA